MSFFGPPFGPELLAGPILLKFGTSGPWGKQFWAIEAFSQIRPTSRDIGVGLVGRAVKKITEPPPYLGLGVEF